jgi:putative salt-induced outer membrane protein
MTTRSPRPLAFLALALVAAPVFAQSQATVKPDGQFRLAFGAGASYASGNTSTSSVNLDGDVVRATDDDKLRITGKAVSAKTNHDTTAENLALDGQYNKDVTPLWFGFGNADFLRDRPANVESRTSLFGGVGRHVVKTDPLTWDISIGVGYTQDRYVTDTEVNDELRRNYGRAEGLLAEESSHKFTPTTTFHQKLSLYPALRSGGGYRGVFDSGLSVSMTSVLALTAGLNYRYNSDSGVGVKKGDTLFVTGITVKID